MRSRSGAKPAAASAPASALGRGEGLARQARAAGRGTPPAPGWRVRAPAISSICRSTSSGWPIRIARMAISRGASRGRPARRRAGAGSAAPAMPTRGPASAKNGLPPAATGALAPLPARAAGRRAERRENRRGAAPCRGRSGGAASRRAIWPTSSRSRRSSAARFSGVSKAWPSVSRANSMSASGCGAPERLGDRRRAARARQIVGVLPLGQQREAQALARRRSAAARCRWRDGPPCARPCRRRSTGSAPRPCVQSSAHCSAVSAVPIGATAWGKPAWVMAITST